MVIVPESLRKKHSIVDTAANSAGRLEIGDDAVQDLQILAGFVRVHHQGGAIRTTLPASGPSRWIALPRTSPR